MTRQEPIAATFLRIYPAVEGVRIVIRLPGPINEKIRKLKAEDPVDDRFVRKLEKEGKF